MNGRSTASEDWQRSLAREAQEEISDVMSCALIELLTARTRLLRSCQSPITGLISAVTLGAGACESVMFFHVDSLHPVILADQSFGGCMSQALPASSRVMEMDAVRGAAMIAVCLSHSADLVAHPSASVFASDLVFIGLIATPTFLLLSGTVCGYMSCMEKQSIDRFRWRLIDRGLFLLTIAHLALSLTHLFWMRGALSFSSFFITDAVGVALISSAFLAPRASPRALLKAGALLYFLSWIASFNIAPSSPSLRYALRMLVGIDGNVEGDEGYIVPLLPYLGIFAIGLGAGKAYASRSLRSFTQRDAALFCLKVGSLCIGAALCLKTVRLIGPEHLSPSWRLIHSSTSFRQKLPPGPAYVLTFGGAGILLTGLVALPGGFLQRSGLVRALATLGRASLVIYIVEYWCFFFPVRVFGWHGAKSLWCIITPTSIVFLWALAFCWDRCGWNRFITLGLRKKSAYKGLQPRNLSPIGAPPEI